MNISILGTGVVGKAHSERLTELGYSVTIGTQNVTKTLGEDAKSDFSVWLKSHQMIELQNFKEAAAKSQIVINALKGDIALEVLASLRQELAGKILIDVANPLDFSGDIPKLSVCNDNSLGEQIQKILKKTKVVKAFNTMNSNLQVNPRLLSNGDHSLFICGNDTDAKSQVADIAKQYGWKDIIDLGDVSSSRGMEMILPVWLKLWKSLGSVTFNIKIMK